MQLINETLNHDDQSKNSDSSRLWQEHLVMKVRES